MLHYVAGCPARVSSYSCPCSLSTTYQPALQEDLQPSADEEVRREAFLYVVSAERKELMLFVCLLLSTITLCVGNMCHSLLDQYVLASLARENLTRSIAWVCTWSVLDPRFHECRIREFLLGLSDRKKT